MALVEIRRNKCLLCKRPLIAFTNGRQKHPVTDECLVRWTDQYGIAIDPEADEEDLPQEELFMIEGLEMFPPVEKVCQEIFDSFRVPRLGGQSSGRGWSAISTFQKCPYLYRLKYLDNKRPFLVRTESPALAVGTLLHTFLALYYTRMINPTYPITPQLMADRLHAKANPKLVEEGWRLFRAYAVYYQHDNLLPLAVEYDLKDPRNGDSCRYDLIVFAPEDEPGSGTRRDGLLPGTYEVEHKSASRFDHATLNGWPNDGEVIGQIALWDRLHLDKRFGPLVGAIVNIVGKQKEPQFHRTVVSRADWLTQQHNADLRAWNARIDLARASGDWPRARASCVHRYGTCDFFDHCAESH